MEQTIKLIVETDKASRLDVDNALKHRENVVEELARAKEQIDAQYKKDAEDKITKARIIAEKESENFKEDLSSLERRKSGKLNKQYEEHHEEWEKAILSKVISK